MSEAYMRLKKRSMNPKDPPLTWREMNDNLTIIEDELNRKRLEVSDNEPNNLKQGEVWIHSTEETTHSE